MKRIGLFCMLSVAISILLAGDTGLFEALRANDQRAVASLVGNGVDANSRNQQGVTALMQAALHASPRLMKLLLDHGADPNARNPLGVTALMWAAGDPAKVKLLLEYRADVNIRANSGRTALIIASAYPGNLQSIRLLLAKGADPKAVDEAGDGPLGNAAGAADLEMQKELLATGASVNERSSRGGSLRGLTPLMRAAGANCVECVRLLLAHGSDVNAVSNEARVVKAGLQEHGRLTPLLMAVEWGNQELIRLLLDKGASLEARDSRGLTALMLAVTNERQDVQSVRLLLDRGAAGEVRASDNQSALSWGRKWGRKTEIVRLLEEHGGRPDDATPYVPARLDPQERSPAEAVERSVALLQASNTVFFRKSGCASCHHQMLAGILVGAARDRGLKVDEKLAEEQLKAARLHYKGLCRGECR
jgi:ankyrin repeat protein